MDTSSILNRLELLERKNRTWRRFGGLATCALLVAVSASWVGKAPRADSVHLQNANGQTIAYLGTHGDRTGLWIYDEHGKSKIFLGEDTSGLPKLAMGYDVDQPGTTLMTVGVGLKNDGTLPVRRANESEPAYQKALEAHAKKNGRTVANYMETYIWDAGNLDHVWHKAHMSDIVTGCGSPGN